MPRRRWPLHPFLATAYPILFLFSVNAADQVTFDPLWAPLLVGLAQTAIVLAAFWLILRRLDVAALATTLVVVLWYGYGHAWNLLAEGLDDQRWLLGGWAVLALVGAQVVWRFRHAAWRATTPLNVLSGVAVAMAVGSLGAFALSSGLVGLPPQPVERVGAGEELPDELPDVYFLVFDRYAGGEALMAQYGWDNEPFLAELERRGFAVARASHANYVKTPLSLVATLDMAFLDTDRLRAEAADGADRGPIHRRLRERLAFPAELKALGYRYVHVANWWEPTITNADADLVLRYAGASEFSAALERTTLLRALSADPAPRDPWDWEVLRAHSEYELDRLRDVPAIGGPKYVFAHLLLPHDPYVFDRDGSFMTREQVAAQGNDASYVRQLEYLNGQILAIVDRILAEDGPDPIIVLQADEGPFPERYRADEWAFRWTDATDAELEEKFGILNAVRLPGVDPSALGWHDAITPVNTFRMVMNGYFGADLPLLADRSWAHESLHEFYRLVEITERLD